MQKSEPNLSKTDIMQRLNVTAMQVEMAEYSGYIPPSVNGVWDAAKLEEYLVRWQDKLNKKRADK